MCYSIYFYAFIEIKLSLYTMYINAIDNLGYVTKGDLGGNS